MAKTHNITNRKRLLPWCELINPYNFFHCQCVSPYVTENVSTRRWSSWDTRESRELQGLGQRLGSCNVSSRSRLRRSRPWLRNSAFQLSDNSNEFAIPQSRREREQFLLCL